MRVLLLRHAIAEEGGGSDAERALTEEGRERMRRGARALAVLVPELALVATSPLRRARETAEIVAAEHPEEPPVLAAPELAPGSRPGGVVALLAARRAVAALALVGHQPDLSRLEAFLLTGSERPLADFKKGGAALLELGDRIAAGEATLVWHLTAGQLRKLAP